MSRVISRKLLFIIIGVCLLPFVMDTLLLSLSQKGALYGIEIDAEQFSDGTHTLSPRLLNIGDPVKSRYTAVLSGEDLRTAGGKHPALLVNRINGQGCRIYLNDIWIGSIGDPDAGRANIWNTVTVFTIDPGLIQASNQLVLDMHHEYGAGIEGNVIFTDVDSASGLLGSVVHSNGIWSYISIGMALSGCIMIMLMIMLNQQRHSPYLYLLFSLLALTIYTFDYINIPYLPVDYIVFKKIMIGSLFLCLAFVSIGVSKFFNKKLPMIISLTILCIVAAGTVVIRDMITFRRFYWFCAASIPFAVAGWIWVIAPFYRVKEEARIFISGFAMFLVMGTFNVVMLYLCPGMLLTSVFPFTTLYMTTIILLMNLDIRRKNETIQQESSRRFHFYRKAITDGLTGLFNRDYMISHLKNEKPPFAVAMLDIDHFKDINDNYGHQAGDRVMQFAARMLTSTLRETDRVGRYGGDEFIIILRSSGANAFAVMERFRSEMAQHTQETEDAQFLVTFSIGICYIIEEETPDQILRKADMALYMAKRNGRNRVCVYEDE